MPRSVQDPVSSNRANIDGTLNVLVAARDAKVKRVVYAASSSAYGDTRALPKREDMPTDPLSPYALQKLVGEQYARCSPRSTASRRSRSATSTSSARGRIPSIALLGRHLALHHAAARRPADDLRRRRPDARLHLRRQRRRRRAARLRGRRRQRAGDQRRHRRAHLAAVEAPHPPGCAKLRRVTRVALLVSPAAGGGAGRAAGAGRSPGRCLGPVRRPTCSRRGPGDARRIVDECRPRPAVDVIAVAGGDSVNEVCQATSIGTASWSWSRRWRCCRSARG